MKIWLNGERVETGDARTIAELAQHYGLAPHTILIEHNGEALRQKDWSARELHDDDRIEFIRVVAGG